MEFRCLGGQHMLGISQQKAYGSGPATLVGGYYCGEHYKITTSGERAIIYKRKEKHPVFSDRYTYSYFLLGSGEITSVDVSILDKGSVVTKSGWDNIELTDNDKTQLQTRNVADFQSIQEPMNWYSVTFEQKYGSGDLYVPFIYKTTSLPRSVFLANMQKGKKLSNEINPDEWKSPFFGYPKSLHNHHSNFIVYNALNGIWNGNYDDKFPTNSFSWDMEYMVKSTLLWKSNGKMTEYGKQFTKSMYNGLELYGLLDNSPYKEMGVENWCGGYSIRSSKSPFSVDCAELGINHEVYGSTLGWGSRMGTTNKGDFLQNLAEEYMFLGIYVTEDYEGAKKYVDDGTVPDDGRKIDDITPKTDEDDTQNEDGKDNSKRDDQTIHNPDNTALNSGSTTYFYMGKAGISSFIKWFWNDTGDFETIVNNYISNLYGDLKECITGVFHFPCPLNALCSSTGNKEIVIGRYNTNINADFLKTPPKNILLGTVNMDDDKWKNTNSFLDYDGYTTISLYLPYLGVVDLPTKTVQKTKLSVYYAVDVPSMQMKYTIKSNGIIVHEQVVQFGDDIPISLSSGLQNVTNTVSAVTGMASDVALLGTMGGGKKAIASTLIHTVANAHTTTDGITVKGNSSGVMGKWGSLKCALIVTKPISKRPSNYAKIKGNLICDTYKLSSLTGLTICENPRITFTNSKPTEKEIEEIYSYLEKGVIL